MLALFRQKPFFGGLSPPFWLHLRGILEVLGTLAATLAPLWEVLGSPGSRYRFLWILMVSRGYPRIQSRLKMEGDNPVWCPYQFTCNQLLLVFYRLSTAAGQQ